eukprot:scaffold44195_cov23-Cyclotella_meneghiniana.AAC.3
MVRMRVSSTKLKYVRRGGWYAVVEPPEYIGDGTDKDLLESLAITDEVLIVLIKSTKKPDELNVVFQHKEQEAGGDENGNNKGNSSDSDSE